MKAVLIADDDPIYIFVIKKYLKAAGFTGELDVLGSSKKTVQLLQSQAHRFGCVLLDINLSDGSCWDVLTMLEESGMEEIPPIYISSASLTANDRERAKKHRLVKDFLTKPVASETIQRLISEHLA